MIIKCPECGHQVSDRARTCPSCGIDIAGNIVRCPDCGEYLFKDDRECPNCHCSINAAASEPAPIDQSSPNTPSTPSNPSNLNTPSNPNAPVIPQPRDSQPPRKKGRKAFWSVVITAFILALIVVLLCIYYAQKTQRENEQRAYENAMMSAEPAVLQNFLDMYIEAPVAHRDSIKAHLTAMMKIDREWENARTSLKKKDLLLFIDRNPDNVHIREARQLIDSLDFETARLAGTMDSYKAYMEEHEQGEYYDEARRAYDQLEEEMIRAAKLKAEQDSIARAAEAAAAALAE